MSKEKSSIVEIIVNKNIYKIACEVGQEEHIQNLAKFINNEVEQLVSTVGQIGEARLLLMTCLIIADKLKDSSSMSDSHDHDFLLEAIKKITHRVEMVADKIKNMQVDQNAKDNSDIKKEFLNLRNKVIRLIDEFK